MRGSLLWGWVGWSLVSLSASVRAAPDPAWLTPIAPFRIADNLYYVGSQDLASYLIVTPQGDILINSSFQASVPLIRASVEKLGFKFKDIKILLISHSHADHDAGSAQIIHDTGAKYMVMDGDVAVVESGGAADFAYPHDLYPPARVDRVLHDADEVRLGDAVLVAHKTAGHTRGCTTWTLRVNDRGRPLNVVIVGSWNVNPGFKLIDKPGSRASYPGIAGDYAHTFATLQALPCDIFLGAHGVYFDMLGKLQKIQAGSSDAVWVDPSGYAAAVLERKAALETELHKQQSTL